MKDDTQTTDAPTLTDTLLTHALSVSASDIHIDPTPTTYNIRLRIDGLLQNHTQLPTEAGAALVTRLMVLAQLLTYKLDIPQEGKLSFTPPSSTTPNSPTTPTEIRLAIMPTTHGLRAVLRLPSQTHQQQSLDQLALPDSTLAALKRFANSDSGMLLVTGPAGSGKTTTIYALLNHIAQQQPGLSIITLEDPVERDLPNITQIQVTPHGQLTYETALRSILRQDPQVLMLGEIRDQATATIAIQAALSGHRLIATLHAGSPETAISRLLEMSIEPHQITSALFGVISQRLLRKINPASDSSPDAPKYAGRIPIAQFAPMSYELRQAINKNVDAPTLRSTLAMEPGYQTLQYTAQLLQLANLTDQNEIQRILGESQSND